MKTAKGTKKAQGPDSAGRTLIPADVLRSFCGRVFRKCGVSEDDARIAADVLVAADLRGIDSHGVARLRGFYVDRLRAGAMSPRPRVRVLRETPVTAVIDGGSGLGHPIAHRAMKLAIDKAGAAGAGFVVVRNSNHFGIAGYYAMMALDSGCIGLCMTSTNPWVVPTFGRDAVLGTNPIAVAVPSGRQRPFVLDMSTSAAPVGKLEVHDRLGSPIPSGWAADERGMPTTAPGEVLRNVRQSVGGGLLPLGGAGEETGGHKGYGLSLWVDIFSVLLSGGSHVDFARHPESAGGPRLGNVCHFFGAWRVHAFRTLCEFQAAVDELLQRLKASRKAEGQDRIYVAGEKEFEETDRRQRDGIPLPAPVVADLQSLASEFDVAFSTGALDA